MYFNSEFASVEWIEDAEVAALSWHKFASGEDFRLPCRKALALALEKGAVTWFSDTTKIGAVLDEDGSWFVEEIVAELLSNGITQQILVIPDSVIAKMTLNKAADSADDTGFKTKYFSNFSEAMAWLAKSC